MVINLNDASRHFMQNLYEAEFGKEDINAGSVAQLLKGFDFLHRYHSLLAESQQYLSLQLSHSDFLT